MGVFLFFLFFVTCKIVDNTIESGGYFGLTHQGTQYFAVQDIEPFELEAKDFTCQHNAKECRQWWIYEFGIIAMHKEF
jgi:hypothetical protein